MRFMVKVCVCVCGCVFIWWVCPFQLSRSDLFNGNDFLEFLAPYSFKIVPKVHKATVSLLENMADHTKRITKPESGPDSRLTGGHPGEGNQG